MNDQLHRYRQCQRSSVVIHERSKSRLQLAQQEEAVLYQEQDEVLNTLDGKMAKTTARLDQALAELRQLLQFKEHERFQNIRKIQQLKTALTETISRNEQSAREWRDRVELDRNELMQLENKLIEQQRSRLTAVSRRHAYCRCLPVYVLYILTEAIGGNSLSSRKIEGHGPGQHANER